MVILAREGSLDVERPHFFADVVVPQFYLVYRLLSANFESLATVEDIMNFGSRTDFFLVVGNQVEVS